MKTGQSRCEYCGACKNDKDLNFEAKIHHGEKLLKCRDRKSCERTKRRNDKRNIFADITMERIVSGPEWDALMKIK